MKRLSTNSIKSTTEIEQTTTKEQEQHITAKSIEQTDIAIDEEVVTVIETYDTSQSVDEVTGVPPLQSKVTQTRRSIQQQQHKQITEDITDTHTVEQELLKQSEEAVEITEVAEKRGLNALQKLLIYMGGISIIAVLLWVGLKLFKRH